MGFNWKELDRYEAIRDAEIARKNALRAEKSHRTGYMNELSVVLLAFLLFIVGFSVPEFIEQGDMDISVLSEVGVGTAIGLVWWFFCRKKKDAPDEEQETDTTNQEEYPTTRYNTFRR